MKNLRHLSVLFCTMMLGLFVYSCSTSPDVEGPDDLPEKKDKCDLLSFSLDGERNELESSVIFEIDEDNLTASGYYLAEFGVECPETLVATFIINGEKVLVDDSELKGDAALSFAENISFTVVAENGKTKTYTISLEWKQKDEEEGPVDPTDPYYAVDKNGSGKCDMSTFKLSSAVNSGLSGTITFSLDQENLTIKGQWQTWIHNDEPDMLIPDFSHTGNRVVVNREVVVPGETKMSFAGDVEFVVVAENGTTKTYTVSLNCPQINNEVPVLRFADISSASKITDKVNYKKTKLNMSSPLTESGWWGENDGEIEMRGRGNSTWGLPKKPYRIKFPVKYSPIGLDHAKERDWVVLGHDMDKSLLRNHIAFEMSRVLFNKEDGYHDPNAVMFVPCSQHVNIYFGENYHGLYQMSDHKEVGEGRLNIEKLTAADTATDLITGGYLLESDVHGDTPRFKSSWGGIDFHMYYPKSDDYNSSQSTYIRDYIATVESELQKSMSSSKWRNYIDEKTMIDFMLVKELAGDYDGFTSTQIYKKRGNPKLYFGPIWDLDKGWDNEVRKDCYSGSGKLIIYEGFYYAKWFQRLWENDATFKANVIKRWNEKKQAMYDVIMKELNEKPAQMAKAIEANFSVWQFYYQKSNEAKMPAKTYELEIERMKTLTDKRMTQLNNLLK